ncbi:MAG: hypothetical protein ACE1Y4_04620, partial [Lysobacterales bacterium]
MDASLIMVADKTNERNAGMDFNPDWLAKVQINRSAIERRAGSLGDRRSIKKHWQVAWLLQAISCIDLTTLAGDDTPGRVRRLCNKAMNPVRREILSSLDVDGTLTSDTRALLASARALITEFAEEGVERFESLRAPAVIA